MSSVIIAGNTSGTITLDAPAVAGTTTLTLPTTSGTIALSGGAVSGTTGSFSGDLSFNSGYGSAAVAYGCRAWVNFNGTGTVAIRASGNVSSITDNGTGLYTVNFTTAMPDALYATVGSSIGSTTSSDGIIASGTLSGSALAAGAVQVRMCNVGSNTATDIAFVNVAIFR
jgi:uncharacterized protein (AIM24 family)